MNNDVTTQRLYTANIARASKNFAHGVRPGKARLTLEDVMIMFMMKAPNQRKAIAALEVLFGKDILKQVIKYKHIYPTYQAWNRHLSLALDSAQEEVDAKSRKRP